MTTLQRRATSNLAQSTLPRAASNGRSVSNLLDNSDPNALINAIGAGKLDTRVDQLSLLPWPRVLNAFVRNNGTTTGVHQLAFCGGEKLVNFFFRSLFAHCTPERYAETMDLSDVTRAGPLHSLAQRTTPLSSDTLAYVIGTVPLAALHKRDRYGNTAITLFTLRGVSQALTIAITRDSSVGEQRVASGVTLTSVAVERLATDLEQQQRQNLRLSRRIANDDSAAMLDAYRRDTNEKIAKLNSELDIARKRASDLAAMQSAKERTMRDAIRARDAAESSSATMCAELNELRASTGRETTALAERERDLAERAAALNEALQELQNVQEERAADAKVAADIQQRVDEARAQRELAERQCNEARKRAEALATSLATVQAASNAATANLEQATLRAAELEGEVARLTARVEQARTEERQKAEQNAADIENTFADDNADIRRQLDEWRRRAAELEQQQLQQQRVAGSVIPRIDTTAVVAAAIISPRRRSEQQNETFYMNVFNAVQTASCDLLKTLFAAAFSANTCNPRGQPLIQIALEETAVLVRQKRDQNCAAALGRMPELFRLLLTNGAEWDGVDDWVRSGHPPETPREILDVLNMRDSLSPFCLALVAAKEADVLKLMPKVTDINRRPSVEAKHGFTYVHMAAYRKMISVLHAMTLRDDIAPDALDARGRTALHIVIDKWHDSETECELMVRYLIAAGADVRIKCTDEKIVGRWATAAARNFENSNNNSTNAKTASGSAGGVSSSDSNSAAYGAKTAAKHAGTVGGLLMAHGFVDAKVLANANLYTTPVAMAHIIGRPTLIDLLTAVKYRAVTLKRLVEYVRERAKLHANLVGAFRESTLDIEIVRAFENLQHVFLCFNPYIDTALQYTDVPIDRKQTIIDARERDICSDIREKRAQIDKVRRQRPESVAANTKSFRNNKDTNDDSDDNDDDNDDDDSDNDGSGDNAVGSGGRRRKRTDTLRVGQSMGETRKLSTRMMLEQIRVRAKQDSRVYWICDGLIKMMTAVDENHFDVAPNIEQRARALYPRAVAAALAELAQSTEAAVDVESVAFIIDRKDGLFGPNASLFVPIDRDMTFAELATASGNCPLLEWALARAPELLRKRGHKRRTLVELAIAEQQPHCVVAIDYHTACARRVVAREDGADTPRSATSSDAPLTARSSRAANASHYGSITKHGSNVLHLFVVQYRDDLMRFAIGSLSSELFEMRDGVGERPIDKANNPKRQPRTAAEHRALANCRSLLESYQEGKKKKRRSTKTEEAEE